MSPICLQCGYPVLKTKAEFIALRPDDTEMWLCGSKVCTENYSDNKPPTRRRVAKAVK